jgi:anti-sigma factor RsiW
MNCNECRRHWELYYDSEGDSELYLEINEHLAECQSCAKWFFQQQQFEVLVTTRLSASEPTAGLWERVLSETGIVRPAAARSWTFFGSCIALAASLLLALTFWQMSPGESSVHLTALTAVVHRDFVEENKDVEFISVSDQEVEQYLKHRVPFSVRCPPREDAGFEVRGGGICAIAGDPTAYVVGRVEGQEVSIFILPEERLDRFAHERDTLDREKIHHCREGELEMVLAKIDRNVVVVIGKAAPQQLEQVVRAYGTYPETQTDNAA